ncbi:methyltransferase family protein [Candidatus Neomarinimicrobiota bacterium]
MTATFNFIAAPPDRVIGGGAYHFSRHPMYLATLFIHLGCGIATASWLFLLLSIISAFFWYRESLVEERYCLQLYGSAYQEYRDRTPRWIGVPRKYSR